MNSARVIFPAVRLPGENIEAVWPEVRARVDLGVGGFILFGGSLEGARTLIERAREAAGRPLLFAADLERGAGQQFEGGATLPPPRALGMLGDAAAEFAGRLTAVEALSAGVGWLLAPVVDLDDEADNPIVGTRSFGPDPFVVSRLASAWIRAAQAAGAIACAKHFPGHGRTTSDSHSELPSVDATGPQLERDLAPFRAAVEAGVKSVMLAHVAYPALDPTGRPASGSSSIVRILREDLLFSGLIVSDALMMDALTTGGRTDDEVALEALGAGLDVLLYPRSPESVAKALSGALADGDERIEREALERSIAGIEAAASDIESLEVASDPALSARTSQLARRAVLSLKGKAPRLESGAQIRLLMIDDDENAAQRARDAVGELRVRDLDAFVRALSERLHVEEASADECGIDVIAVVSEVRAWKGRAGLSDESRARLSSAIAGSPVASVVLFGGPRLAADITGAETLLCAWSADEAMQRAAAEYLLERSE